MFEEVDENCWGDGYRIATQGLRLSEPKREMRMIQLQEVTQQARFNTKAKETTHCTHQSVSVF